MAVKDIFKVSRKTFFNPREWLGYDGLKSQTKTIWEIIKNLFTPTKPQRSETFTEAVARLSLTEKDIQERKTTFLNYAYAFLILAAGAFVASFYFLIVYHTFAGMMLGLAVTALLLTQAFRFHFWYFQMKYKKLGCTYQEWRQGKPLETKEPKV